MNFRFASADVARRLSITGRVRNTHDGDVEAVAEGENEAVERFVSWWRQGPPSARVDDVIVDDLDGERRYRDFKVTYESIDER